MLEKFSINIVKHQALQARLHDTQTDVALILMKIDFF